MKKSLSIVRNKWRQFAHRLFLSDTNNNHILWYETFILYLVNLDSILEKRLKFERPNIIVVSDNILVKVILFMYSFITNIDLTVMSLKFDPKTIVNLIASRKANVLIIDKIIETGIIRVEEEEFISILKYFKYVETTGKILEIIGDTKVTEDVRLAKLNRLYKKGLFSIHEYDNNIVPRFTTLSPGTTNQPCFINIPYKVLLRASQIMSYFLGLRPGDNVSIITDFEFFPNVFTLLGFLTGVRLIQPVNDITSATEFVEEFKNSKSKPSTIIIDSFRFKLIWDSILSEVYSSKLMFILSRYKLSALIVNWVVLRKLRQVFSKETKKVHILNEELGTYCLNILRKSKIMFTSSYGYLEQGNFLAFKTIELFKHKKYFNKPGGTVLKDNENLFDKVYADTAQPFYIDKVDEVIGEIVTELQNGNGIREMRSEDLGSEMKNVTSQGDRKYLAIYGRRTRYSSQLLKVSFELIEKSIKDSLLIRDCLLIKSGETLAMYIEPREELFDIHHVEWEELESVIKIMIADLKKNNNITISSYAILRFNGMRNVAGKLQYYFV